MQPIIVDHIQKNFVKTRAVDDVSFAVNNAEIFGLLGPNGAGKTTTIRIILDIFKPDKGSISILGGPMNEAKKDRIGYLPEERGLYQDISLERCLSYLAGLKGLSSSEIRLRLSLLPGLILTHDFNRPIDLLHITSIDTQFSRIV